MVEQEISRKGSRTGSCVSKIIPAIEVKAASSSMVKILVLARLLEVRTGDRFTDVTYAQSRVFLEPKGCSGSRRG